MPNILTNDQITSLKNAHKQARDKRSADRIKAVLALSTGHEYAEVASILLLDETTLRRYVERFKAAGIDGLLECHYKGGSSDDLTPTQLSRARLILDR